MMQDFERRDGSKSMVHLWCFLSKEEGGGNSYIYLLDVSCHWNFFPNAFASEYLLNK